MPTYLIFLNVCDLKALEKTWAKTRRCTEWVIEGMKLDVMPIDEKILSFTKQWYRPAMNAASEIELEPELLVRVITAPYFWLRNLKRSMGAAAAITRTPKTSRICCPSLTAARRLLKRSSARAKCDLLSRSNFAHGSINPRSGRLCRAISCRTLAAGGDYRFCWIGSRGFRNPDSCEPSAPRRTV
jgi:hypothetical protein